MKRLFLFIGSFGIVNGFSSPPISIKTTNLIKKCQVEMSNPAVAKAVARILYPTSMVGVLGELYFRTTNEMECPRGAVSCVIQCFD